MEDLAERRPVIIRRAADRARIDAVRARFAPMVQDEDAAREQSARIVETTSAPVRVRVEDLLARRTDVPSLRRKEPARIRILNERQRPRSAAPAPTPKTLEVIPPRDPITVLIEARDNEYKYRINSSEDDQSERLDWQKAVMQELADFFKIEPDISRICSKCIQYLGSLGRFARSAPRFLKRHFSHLSLMSKAFSVTKTTDQIEESIKIEVRKILIFAKEMEVNSDYLKDVYQQPYDAVARKNAWMRSVVNDLARLLDCTRDALAVQAKLREMFGDEFKDLGPKFLVAFIPQDVQIPDIERDAEGVVKALCSTRSGDVKVAIAGIKDEQQTDELRKRIQEIPEDFFAKVFAEAEAFTKDELRSRKVDCSPEEQLHSNCAWMLKKELVKKYFPGMDEKLLLPFITDIIEQHFGVTTEGNFHRNLYPGAHLSDNLDLSRAQAMVEAGSILRAVSE